MRIFSNGPRKDYVINPFNKLAAGASQLYLAAPYFTQADAVLNAVKSGKTVQLLVGLNSATSPDALKMVHEIPGLAVRYLTNRFHAKIYIFNDAALLGSSNLTDGGLYSNREGTICLYRAEDREAVEEIRALFAELWEAGQVLTREKLAAFTIVHKRIRGQGFDPDGEIENAVGKAPTPSISVESHKQSQDRIFLEGLRQEVYEQYRPAFNEVTAVLEENRFRRSELADLGIANETNRFLNWLRLTHVVGDEAWQMAPLRSADERRTEITRFGREWTQTKNNKIPEDYAAWIANVQRIFGTRDSLEDSSKDDIITGLMSLHAFLEQQRFVKGGAKALPAEFWKRNEHSVEHVKKSLLHLLHGPGEFIQRLHDILYDPLIKLGLFGRFCALELYGTIKPEECPPMNGRMAKALRYLGFSVKGT